MTVPHLHLAASHPIAYPSEIPIDLVRSLRNLTTRNTETQETLAGGYRLTLPAAWSTTTTRTATGTAGPRIDTLRRNGPQYHPTATHQA